MTKVRTTLAATQTIGLVIVVALVAVVGLALTPAVPRADAHYVSSVAFSEPDGPSYDDITALARTGDGRLLVGNEHSDSTTGETTPGIQVVGSNGQLAQTWTGPTAAPFGPITSIAVAPAGGGSPEHYWATETDAVQAGTVPLLDELASDGSVLQRLTGTGEVGGSFAALTSVAVAPDGDVYVADSGALTVDHFSSTGVFLGSFGGCEDPGGAPDGTFRSDCSQPPDLGNDSISLAVRPDGKVFAAQPNSLQRFSADGDFEQAPLATTCFDTAGTPGGDCRSSRCLAAPTFSAMGFDTAGELVALGEPMADFPTPSSPTEAVSIIGLEDGSASSSGGFSFEELRDRWGTAADGLDDNADPAVSGLAIVSDGTLYVGDVDAATVRRLTPDGPQDPGDACKVPPPTPTPVAGGGSGSGTTTSPSTPGPSVPPITLPSLPPLPPPPPPGPRASIARVHGAATDLRHGRVRLLLNLDKAAMVEVKGSVQLAWHTATGAAKHHTRHTVVHGVFLSLAGQAGQVKPGQVLVLHVEHSVRPLLKRTLAHHPVATVLYDGSASAGGGTTPISGELDLGRQR